MDTLLSFWAKLDTDTWPQRYHPVLYHLIDVAAVTQGLWDGVFRGPFRRWLAGRLGLATRVGLEDTLVLPDGERASSNAQLVAEGLVQYGWAQRSS